MVAGILIYRRHRDNAGAVSRVANNKQGKMPSVQVLYFARAREATGGVTEETFELAAGAADTEHLKALLVAKHPALGSVLESAVLAVNQEYAAEVREGRRRVWRMIKSIHHPFRLRVIGLLYTRLNTLHRCV